MEDKTTVIEQLRASGQKTYEAYLLPLDEEPIKLSLAYGEPTIGTARVEFRINDSDFRYLAEAEEMGWPLLIASAGMKQKIRGMVGTVARLHPKSDGEHVVDVDAELYGDALEFDVTGFGQEDLAQRYRAQLDQYAPQLSGSAAMNDSLVWAWAKAESEPQQRQAAIERRRRILALRQEMMELGQLSHEELALLTP